MIPLTVMCKTGVTFGIVTEVVTVAVAAVVAVAVVVDEEGTDVLEPQAAKIIKAGSRMKSCFFHGEISFHVSDYIMYPHFGLSYSKIYAFPKAYNPWICL
jgi:hypothetical protein